MSTGNSSKISQTVQAIFSSLICLSSIGKSSAQVYRIAYSIEEELLYHDPYTLGCKLESDHKKSKEVTTNGKLLLQILRTEVLEHFITDSGQMSSPSQRIRQGKPLAGAVRNANGR